MGARGIRRSNDLVAALAAAGDHQVPGMAGPMLALLVEPMRSIDAQITEAERQLVARARDSEVCRRLMTMPGVGHVSATALAASVPDISAFKSGRHFSAWLGPVPRQHASGGKGKLGPITKRGDGYLRKLLVHGARSLSRHHRDRSPWLAALLRRRPTSLAAVAIANRNVRVAWALMARGATSKTPGTAMAA